MSDTKLHKVISRCTAVLGVAALALAGAAAVPSPAHADTQHHYYVEIGGTGSAVDGPACTSTYTYANQHLDGGIPVPVCYPASGGPFVGSHNEMPAPLAPSFADSVQQGYQNALTTLQNTYRADPTARFTVVGYSQGAWVGDLLLQTISANGTTVPRSQVDGMLYSDPRQPGTGFWHLLPAGVPLPLVAVSPGTGPVDFPGVPVQRFCIHTDGICDATGLDSFGGFLQQHPRYWQDGNVMTRTIAQDGGSGIVWLPAEA